MKKSKDKHSSRRDGIKIHWLAAMWGVVLLAIVLVIAVGVAGGLKFEPWSYYGVTVIVSFSSFIATSFFSISIYNHNAAIRDMNHELRSQTNSVNKRAEAFRNLQFIASNYTIADFVDCMTIYPEYEEYRAKLTETKSFGFYLLEQGINKDDVIENFNNYAFVTVRLPLQIVEGKAIGRIIFRRFKFIKDNDAYRFLPASPDSPSKALILFNERDKRQEALINLIMRADSGFYKSDEVNAFSKIKIDLSMESLLGVIVNGSIEIYFTNPEKIEKTGASRYKINSSQFDLAGMPKLCVGKEYEID